MYVREIFSGLDYTKLPKLLLIENKMGANEQGNLTLSFAARLAPKVKVNSPAPALLRFNEDDDQDYRKMAAGKSLMRREGGCDEHATCN